MEANKKIAALDIGGTSIKAGLYVNGSLDGVKEFDTDAIKGGDYVMKRAIEILHELGEFNRLGISTAGQVDSSLGIIRYANSNIPGYTGMEVRTIMEQEFRVPVFVENDVNAAAMGEAMFGAGMEVSDFLCLTYGTGVGGAIVIDKKLYKGSHFLSGEFGGMVVHSKQRNSKEDIFSGCYEQYASTTALVKRVKKLDETLDNGRKIFAALNRDEIKHEVDQWILEIINGLVSLIHIFNPSCIILGGGIMDQEYILKRIEEWIYPNIMESFRTVAIKQAKLGNIAGLLGVVYGAMQLKKI